MSKIVSLFTVYEKSVAYLTCYGLDEEVANSLGFELYEPENGRLQFYLEKPSKKHLPKFLAALLKNNIKAKVVPYDDTRSEELEWDIWDGYIHGIKNNDEMKKIAEKFIKNDPDHSHLAAARIKYVYKKGKPQMENNGQITLAYVELANRFSKHLGKWDFIMVTYERVWDALNDEQKQRLVDHELYHLKFSGNPYIVGHDFEEFHRMHQKYNVPYGQNIYAESQEIAKLVLEDDEEE